ncbi:hypothetical protein BOTBODRAFT_133052 [Botryobasidium botryosum FD-172 SS1]|uniref:arginine--tRNA ligase n=1 Tax=Botryobasidium botryosum (strain FD-172 SS1) TaxID=930990 RepID=A0A067MDK0_BOTB1|nr:hypothetical protein BOTBODRAFT_133052 [Botryobasidium botryosum FD-172 SS1]
MTLPTLPSVQGTDPDRVVLDSFRVAVAEQVAKALRISIGQAYQAVDIGKKGCDFSVPMPRLQPRISDPSLKGLDAKQLVQKVVQEFVPNDYIAHVVAADKFLHFEAKSSTLMRLVLDQIHALSRSAPSSREGYGTNSWGAGKTLVMEFSSPNIAKPFHAGHLRSTIIGTFIANVYEANGWNVVRMNYLGDWGKQFGLLAVGFERYGSREELEKDAIMHLFNVYVSVNADVEREKQIGQGRETSRLADEYFHRMEKGDESALGLWQEFRDLSIKRYKETYQRLNVAFTVYAGESLVSPDGIKRALDTLREKGLLTEKTIEESEVNKSSWKKIVPASDPEADTSSGKKDGQGSEEIKPAWAVDLGSLGKPVLQKPNGTSIYIVRDIAGAIQRYQTYSFDKMIYVVGDQQDLHFKQFFKILGLMGEQFVDRLEHVNFGRVNGMSTRKGKVKFLDDILDAAREAMLTQMEKNPEKASAISHPEVTSDQIGMTAVKVQDMQAKRIISYDFDLNRMTSFEGDTGPYLQYAHVRLCSLERTVAPELVLPSSVSEIDTSLLTEPKARDIVLLLASYPDVVRSSFETREPCTVVKFCFRLSHLISSAWESLIVKGRERELALARLYLYLCARDVLASAMRLLSLVPLEYM